MTPEHFEQLLYEEESLTLDFKEYQYAFSKADEDQKSELLKDIIGFANSWRRSEAYILIGVKEIRGNRSSVVGISEHLDDHSLQQFVNTKTNRPLQFSYGALIFEGKQVGIITIALQERPFWLNKDFGKLKKDLVYIRRGSSTDPTKPASLDEVEKMIKSYESKMANLKIQFANIQNDCIHGESIHIEGRFVKFPSTDHLPDFDYSRQHASLPFPHLNDLLQPPNSEYYRESALYYHHNINFKPIKVVVTNCGKISAEDVQLELKIPASNKFEVLEECDIIKDYPRKGNLINIARLAPKMSFHQITSLDGGIDIVRNPNVITLEVKFGKIQPGRSVLTEKFYVACSESGTITIEGCVYSKQLPQPHKFVLTMDFEITQDMVDIDRFLELADNPDGLEENNED